MPRQPRLDIPGLLHHVMARGIEGGVFFRCNDDRHGFLKRLDIMHGGGGGTFLSIYLLNELEK